MGDNRMPESRREISSKTWNDFDSLKSEVERKKTFTGWPLSFVTPADLAKAGFFYLKDRDRVQCIFCRGIVGDWEDGDQPMQEHSRHFPYCPLIRNLSVGNIPDGEVPKTRSNGFDLAGHYDFPLIRSNSNPERCPNNPISDTVEDWEQYGILVHTGPKHPCYAGQHARMHSYTNNWPPLPQNPELLSAAGFFYMGISDHVRCFYCDGGLRNWEPSDDPWVEHARWFPKCGFVELSKGRDFINEYSAERMANEASSSTNPRITSLQSRTVSLEEIENSMGSDVVTNVLEFDLGFTREQIRSAVTHQLQRYGVPFKDPNSLVDTIIYISENSGEIKSSYSKPTDEVNSDITSTLVNVNPTENLKGESTQSVIVEPRSGFQKGLNASVNLKDFRLCKICMDEEVGVVFLPCGHLVSCVNCALSLKTCPVCRQDIKGTVRTYLS